MPLTSYAPLNLCVHKLDAKSPRPVSWPQFATDTIGALATPLPGCLTIGPYPFLRESSRSLLGELQAASPGHRTAPILKQDMSVLQTLDTILSAVVAARATHYFLQGGLNPRTPLFVGFVQSVLLAHTGDLILREDLAFVLPRYPYAEESSLFELLPRYSQATLTGFCSVETRKWSEEPDEVMEDLDAMSVSTDHDQDSQSSRSRSLSPRFDSHIDETPALDAEPSDNSDDLQPFHHWCDKHMFIDKDMNPDVACVFVMTEQRKIYHALSSALYHRRAIGIQEPIIGLTFGEHGSCLYLILAWLGEARSGQTLPVVHIMHAPFEENGTVLNGVFDMRHPISAIYLARVLLSLPQNLPRIASQALHESRSSPMDIDMQLTLSWRADQTLPGIEIEPASNDGITAWVEGLPAYNVPATLESDLSPGSMSSEKKTGPRRSAKGAKSDSKAQSSLRSVDENVAVHHVTVNDKLPVASRHAVTKALSNYSMSVFAGLPDSNAADIDHITYWLLSRSSVRDSKTLPELYNTLAEEYDLETHIDFCNQYDDLLALCWPPSWDSVEHLPKVRPELEYLSQHLFRAVEARKNCPGRLPIQELTDPVLLEIITSQFQDLLQVVADAIAMKGLTEQVKVPEASFRTGFDRLMRLFYDGEGATERLSVLEAKISMPRNDLADALMTAREKSERDAVKVTHDWADSATSVIERHRKHLRADVTTLDYLTRDKKGGNTSHLELLRANALSARDLYADAVNRITDDFNIVMNRALWEPSTGTVDNIGLVRIPDFFAPEDGFSTDAINTFSLFDVPKSTKNNLASDSEAIETLQRLLGRRIDKKDCRDPLVTALHEYLVELPVEDLSEHTDNAQSPPHTASASSGAARRKPPAEPTKQDALMNMYRDLFLPMIAAEYKKTFGAFSIQGPNQVRSYIVAALKFLSTCSIDEFLLFSLYTEGTVGVVQAGWKEKTPRSASPDPAKGGIHLLDRNCQAFDISDVLGAFTFAIFLTKLAHQHAPKLRAKFEAIRLGLHKDLRDKDPRLSWKYSHQMAKPEFMAAKEAAIEKDEERREQEIEAAKKKAAKKASTGKA